jgi:hypothetical protein
MASEQASVRLLTGSMTLESGALGTQIVAFLLGT